MQRATERRIRAVVLTEEERSYLRQHATYEGSPYHKRNPGDFGLTPPSLPRLDKTLCDEAGVMRRNNAAALFAQAIEAGVVSESVAEGLFPKQLWVVDARGQVFEAMYGGSRSGCYHGYPIRRSDPLFAEVIAAWGKSK